MADAKRDKKTTAKPRTPRDNGRKDRVRGVREPKQPKSTPRRRSALEKDLSDFFGNVSGLLLMSGDQPSSVIVENNAPALAEAWAKLAEKHDGVKRIILALTRGSDWSQAIMITAATIIPIAAIHEWIPTHYAMPYLFAHGLVPESPEVSGETPESDERPTDPDAG